MVIRGTSYAGLKTAVRDILARDDISDTAIDLFIASIEQEIRNELRVREQEREVDIPVVDGKAELPADFLYARFVSYGDEPLLQTDPRTYYKDPRGKFMVVGNEIHLDGEATHCTIIYDSYLPTLSNDNLTNAVSSRYPAVYLYGVMREACYYINDTDKALLYEEKFQHALELACIQEDQSRHSGSKLVAFSE